MNNLSSPAYYRGVIAANGMGSIFAVCPDGRSVDVPVSAGYVSDGFTWGSARSESSRATASTAARTPRFCAALWRPLRAEDPA